MRDRPKGYELLASARKLLREKVLPALPAEHKHGLLMVMKAMSIAERQLQYGEVPERDELQALAALLGEPCADLGVANRRLSLRLREGSGDPGQTQHTALFAHLRAVGRQRLLESNPKVFPATTGESDHPCGKNG